MHYILRRFSATHKVVMVLEEAGGKKMSADAIFKKGVFESRVALMSALHKFSAKGDARHRLLRRERPLDGVFVYSLNPSPTWSVKEEIELGVEEPGDGNPDYGPKEFEGEQPGVPVIAAPNWLTQPW